MHKNSKLTTKQLNHILALKQQGLRPVDIHKQYPWLSLGWIRRIGNPKYRNSNARSTKILAAHARLEALDARILLAEGYTVVRIASMAETSSDNVLRWLKTNDIVLPIKT